MPPRNHTILEAELTRLREDSKVVTGRATDANARMLLLEAEVAKRAHDMQTAESAMAGIREQNEV